MMNDLIYEEFDVIKISKGADGYVFDSVSKAVISEISLKIFVNNTEVASLPCLNRQQEALALGFLYNEGMISSFADIKDICYNENIPSVAVTLQDGISVNNKKCLDNTISGSCKRSTYLNSLKKKQDSCAVYTRTFSVGEILTRMARFTSESELFKLVGGVHSLLFYTPEHTVFSEDIGRHNCFDKVTGALLKEGRLALPEHGIIFISGRVSSEIMTKVIRLGAPVIVSKSTPTAAAVKLAKEYNITLLGYARNDAGYIYSGAGRILQSQQTPHNDEAAD